MLNRTISLILLVIVASLPMVASAASRDEINARVKASLDEFYKHSPEGKELGGKARGMLVFPSVVKAGFGVGGEYGEGALLVGGKPVAYYSVAAASIGFQLGVQKKSEIIMFMTSDALSSFQSSEGWEAGVDGSVALITIGAGGVIDTATITDPIIGFIFSNKGLMYNLTLEGSKITKIDK